jgi:hypothetical protein
MMINNFHVKFFIRSVWFHSKPKTVNYFHYESSRIRFLIQFNLIFVMFILISFQCKNPGNETAIQKNNCNSLVLTANIKKDSLRFNELIDSLKVVRLETNNASLFGDVTKIEILNDTIIIFDINSQVILTFNIYGNFLQKIGAIGKGPNEILFIRNIAVDRAKKEILVLDDRNLKILHFGLNGNFISWEDAKIYPFDFIPHHNHFLFFQNKSPFFFDETANFDLIYTSKNKIIQSYFPFKQELSFRYPLNRVFYELNDTICFVDKWNAKVYSLINGEIFQRFCIDFLGDEIPIELTENEKLFDSEHKKYAYLYDYVVENKSHIYFRYFWKGELRKSIYNKKRKEYHTFSGKSDKTDFLSLCFAPKYNYGDFFVSEIPPFLLVDAFQKGVFKTGEINVDMSKIQQSDNLLLVFYKLKI